MYWLKDQKLKLVGRYLYQKADQAEGLRLNSRYAPLADTRDSFIDLNSGHGDEHQAVYLGLNYYLCGENLKMISGIQHDELQSMGSTQYRGWTWGSSIRMLVLTVLLIKPTAKNFPWIYFFFLARNAEKPG